MTSSMKEDIWTCQCPNMLPNNMKNTTIQGHHDHKIAHTPRTDQIWCRIPNACPPWHKSKSQPKGRKICAASCQQLPLLWPSSQPHNPHVPQQTGQPTVSPDREYNETSQTISRLHGHPPQCHHPILPFRHDPPSALRRLLPIRPKGPQQSWRLFLPQLPPKRWTPHSP